jgi:hypothetical protein
MWRSVFILCVLQASQVVAAESRNTMRVGITITGNVDASALNPKPAGSGAGPRMVIPLPPQRPALAARDGASWSR